MHECNHTTARKHKQLCTFQLTVNLILHKLPIRSVYGMKQQLQRGTYLTIALFVFYDYYVDDLVTCMLIARFSVKAFREYI